jgi:hypothetical protein
LSALRLIHCFGELIVAGNKRPHNSVYFGAMSFTYTQGSEPAVHASMRKAAPFASMENSWKNPIFFS